MQSSVSLKTQMAVLAKRRNDCCSFLLSFSQNLKTIVKDNWSSCTGLFCNNDGFISWLTGTKPGYAIESVLYTGKGRSVYLTEML